MADDAVRLPIDFGDAPQEAAALTTRLQALQAEARELYDAFNRGTLSGDRFREEMGRIGAESRKLAASMDRLDDATASAAHGVGGRGGGMAGFGMAVMQASRGIQDFQAAGLMGMVNNVEGLALALGLSSGLAGAATLAMVALQVLGPVIVGLGKESKAAADEVERLEARIKELEAKPIKLEADYAELDQARREIERLRAAKDALDKAMGRQGEDEKASGRATADVLADPANRAALGEMRERFVRGAIGGSGAARDAAQEVERQQAQLRAYQEELATTNDPARRRQLEAGLIPNQVRLIREAEAAKMAVERDVASRAEASIDQAVQQAQEGVGLGQDVAQRRLIAMLNAAGPDGRRMAAGIAAGSQGRMREARELTEQGAAEEPAALMALERARREEKEADAADEELFAQPERTGRQAAANMARRRREAEQARRDRDRTIGGVAGDVGPALAPELMAALSQTGGRANDAMLRGVQQRIAGAPGVTADNSLAVAAEVLRQTVAAYQQRMWEQQQQMLQMMGMMQQQFGGAQWNAGRMRPMNPTFLPRRPL